MGTHFTLAKKLMLLYLLLAVLPIILISIFSYEVYLHDTNQIESSLLDYAAVQVSDNLAVKIDNYKKQLAEIVTDDTVQSCAIRLRTELSVADFAITKSQMTSKFSLPTWEDYSITEISYITDRYELINFDRLSDTRLVRTPRLSDLRLRQDLMARAMRNNPQVIDVFSPRGMVGAPDSLNSLIFFSYPAYDWVHDQIYGTFLLEVNVKEFLSIINGETGTVPGTSISPYSCITDGEGKIITASESAILGKNISDIPLKEKGISNHITRPIRGTQLLVHLYFQRGSLQKFIDQFGTFVVIITVLISLIFLFIVSLMVRRLSDRANQVGHAMESFSQDQQDVELNIDPEDDIFYFVGGEFHQMATKISSLLEELTEKNERIAQESDQRRRAEIKALQAQINPHFLYNALDRINWMAIENDQTEISEMLSGLGSLLRYSVSNIDMLVPLLAEIEWMKKYIFIQSRRFDREIDFCCSTTEEARNFPIYKMLLQPLVENSILHAMDDKKTNFKISISSEVMSGNFLWISLSDNGSGMDEVQLEKIRSILSRKEGLFLDSIGISNVANRLWLYYGEQAEISVESTKGIGTRFVLLIPYKEAD